MQTAGEEPVPEGPVRNPKGRPRGSKNLATIVRQVLSARVSVRENGRVKTITAREGLIAQLVREGLRGNLRALELMFKVPLLQKELADLGKSSSMTLEDWEPIAILVRGELNPGHRSGEEGEFVRRHQTFQKWRVGWKAWSAIVGDLDKAV